MDEQTGEGQETGGLVEVGELADEGGGLRRAGGAAAEDY